MRFGGKGYFERVSIPINSRFRMVDREGEGWDLARGRIELPIEGMRRRERETERERYVHSDTANDYIAAVH